MNNEPQQQYPLMATHEDVQASAAALRREQWKTRCLELAERNHLIGAARWEHVSELNPAVEIFTVPSARGDLPHVVGHDMTTDAYFCDCIAASYNNPCGHRGAVIAAIMRRFDLLERVETACQAWEREGLGESLLNVYRTMTDGEGK